MSSELLALVTEAVVVLSARARSVDRLSFKLLDALSKRDGL